MVSESTTANNTAPPESSASDGEKNDEEFKDRLASLPEKYREEILKQYDLPDTNATLLHILGYATWIDVVLMVLGTLFSMGSGTSFDMLGL